MSDTDKNMTAGGRKGRDADMAFLSGIEDIVLPDELPEEDAPAPKKEKEYSSEYEQWLEENLKEAKGYGQKVAYEGELPKEDNSWYENSTHAAYDRQMADAQARIRALKERDAKIKAREDFIHDSLPNLHGYSGDPNHFWAMLGSMVWYGATALAGAGLGYCFGLRGADMIPMAGVGGVIGAIIRYNGKEGFSLTEAMQRGAVEIGLCIAGLILGLLGLFMEPSYKLILILAGVFSSAGVLVRERVFFVRPWTEVFFKMLPFIIATPSLITLIYVYKLLKASGYL